jgi:hypothetical protein
MYASVQNRPLSYSYFFRSCGRLGGLIVMGAWLALAANELLRYGPPSPEAYPHAGALAIVFAGYVIGWRKEVLGGVLAVAGTIAFYVSHFAVFGTLPLPAAAWLAAPGIFYLLARYLDEHRSDEVAKFYEH